MKILSIETSCDDTGIAILNAETRRNLRETTRNFEVLANIVASQVEMGKKYGGVFPAMAKREHQKNLLPTFTKALKEAKLLNPKSDDPKGTPNPRQIQNPKFKILNEILEREPELYKKLSSFLKKYEKPDIDLIAITNGPGLEPCLWVGVNFAKALSYFWDIPVVPVNHIESHILVNFLPESVIARSEATKQSGVKFPAVCLVVSGGHTQIILVEKIGKYKVLGETRDDAAGECFDKCAKILGLGYPGGPIIAKLAAQSVIARSEATKQSLPRPMINTKDYDFSFSGLKTAVLYVWQKIESSHNLRDSVKSDLIKKQMAVEIQQAIIDVLIKKTMQAVKDYGAKTLILGGGVSANAELRKQFSQKFENVIFPESKLSTDNGLMIAIAGYFNRKNTVDWKNIQANGNLRIE